MKLEKQLEKKPIFDVNYLQKFIPNRQTAKNTLVKLQKQGKVYKIRSNMYSCIKNGKIIANPYQIASAINSSSYVSHLSALAYYGKAELGKIVYVGTTDRFNDFECEGIHYHSVVIKKANGVCKGIKDKSIKVTCYERTLIDLVKDIDKYVSYEEVLRILEDKNNIDYKKMRSLLRAFKNQFLCQKIGFFFQDQEGKPEYDLLKKYCHAKIGDSKRYITKNIRDKKYNGEWNLIIPATKV